MLTVFSDCRRKKQEQQRDLEQEKHFLEVKVESLEKEVAQYKESTHQQRIHALDLKHELQGVIDVDFYSASVSTFCSRHVFSWLKSVFFI